MLTGELLTRLSRLTNWVPRRRNAWIRNSLAPGLVNLYGKGYYVPPVLLAELLAVDSGDSVRVPARELPPTVLHWRPALESLHRGLHGDLSGERSARSSEAMAVAVGRRLRVQDEVDIAGLENPGPRLGDLIARHVAHYEAVKRGSSLELPGEEQHVNDFIDGCLAGPQGFAALVGESVCCSPPTAARLEVDPHLGALTGRALGGAIETPRVPATHDGGQMPRETLFPVGEHAEWARGHLPDNSSRLAALEHAYREYVPEYHMLRAQNGDLVQSYGRRQTSATRRAVVLVDVDLAETEEMHRFTKGSRRGSPISLSRALLCHALHRFALASASHDFVLVTRLRRWPASGTRPGERQLLPRDVSVWRTSPAAVQDWLAFHAPEFVRTWEIGTDSSNRTLRLAGGYDHHARLVIGGGQRHSRWAGTVDRGLTARSAVGVRLELDGSDVVRFTSGPPEGLVLQTNDQALSFESVDQLADMAVGLCLLARTSTQNRDALLALELDS